MIFLNIPNFLSLIRIILIPITARLFYIGKIETAAAVFVAACLTDILDGYIARHFNMVTDLGKILDPLADKGMQLTVLISMATCGLMPKAVVIMILCKEVIQVVGGSILYKLGVVISAKASGKAATVVSSVCVVSLILFHGVLSYGITVVLQWLPVLFAALAFLRYLFFFISVKKTQ